MTSGGRACRRVGQGAAYDDMDARADERARWFEGSQARSGVGRFVRGASLPSQTMTVRHSQESSSGSGPLVGQP